MSLPPLGDEPTATDADDARFDVRRERQVLEEEALQTRARPPRDPTPTVRPPPPETPTATPRPSTTPSDVSRAHLRTPRWRSSCAWAMPATPSSSRSPWGDAEAKIVDFCDGFERMRELGFAPEMVAGALASCDNKVEDAISSCLR